MSIYCYKFKEIYNEDVCNKIVDILLSESKTYYALNKIVNLSNVSIAHLLPSIMSKLPSGYVLKLSINKLYKYLYSSSTFISSKGNENNEYWYNKYSIRHESFEAKGLSLNLWVFKANFEFSNNIDKRLSKDILRTIVESYNLDKKSKASIYGHINGIIGHLKNNKSKYSKNEFYNILKQKFIGDESIEFIIKHNEFEVFLTNKVVEIYNK